VTMSSALAERFLKLAEDYQKAAEQLRDEHIFDRIYKIANWQTRIYLTMFFSCREWTVMELSRYLNVDQSIVTRSLKRLLKNGYVRRSSRKKWVVL